MDISEDQIREKVKRFISSTFKVEEAEINDEIDLFSNGIVDSLSAAEVVTYLEQEFDIRFHREHLFDERFLCVHGMAQIIKEIKDSLL
jgi:acyl carrier protein